MPRELTYLLGERDGRPYFLLVRATPHFEQVEEFAVVVYYNDPTTERRVQIARIDTSHGYTHFDRLYRRNRPKDAVNLELWDAVDLLDSNWRRYAEQYEDAHGD